MRELVTYIAKSLVANPDEVFVSELKNDHETVFQIKVAEEDMGRIIGKQGKIAKAIRTLTKAAAIKEGIMVQVEISDQ